MARVAESRALQEARAHLAAAEAAFRTAAGLGRLEEGLALLDDVALEGAAHERRVAANLAAAYVLKICDRVRQLVVADPALPEPDLEQLFKVLLAFDQCRVELPQNAVATKVEIVRKLIDRYYEGHSHEAKQAALAELAAVSKASRER